MFNKVSITDVARKAGVSKATVSRVLNQSDVVDSDMVESVKQVIDELNYKPRPNRKRRGVLAPPQRELGFGNIALIFAGEERRGTMRTPLSTQLITGVETYLFLNDINCITAFWQIKGRGGREEKVPICIQNGQIDGFIFRSLDLEYIENRDRGIPKVQVFEGNDDVVVDKIMPDNEAIAKLAFNSLFEKGHTHIALVDDWAHHLSRKRRRVFFKMAAEEAGVEVKEYLIDCGRNDNYDCYDKYLADKDRPSAVYDLGQDDSVDVLLYKMREKNLRAGYDIDIIAAVHEPVRFTHLDGEIMMISIEAEQVGYAAAEMLHDRIKNPKMGYRKTLVEPQIWTEI